MPIQRPTGVTILAVLQFIGGVLSLLFGLSSLFFGGLMVASYAAATAGAEINMGPVLLIAAVVAIISGLIGLLAGYGLFTLKGWGWTLAMVFSVINVISNVLGLIQGGSVPGSIVGIVISGLIIYYLNQSNVKRAFGKA
ncbi:hypothetical protein IQ254_24025 [Nodosilinea sp. LEGE 07088]|uniref:hypothetical protein n=1 Tax=Nodosilinea sp. LEGE 07088 TaxID=2777968 RepID=UPI0018828880|nr:hypothetical protein [Nodosilinea sp. LEGE 07088]MBE9140230.1 hypothetical protein [Nodosilinea sp. LEGE 07088]